MSIVIDASFAIHLCGVAPSAELETRALALAREDLTAPAIFWHEVASGLRNMLLGRHLTLASRSAVLQAVRALDVTISHEPSRIEGVIAVSDTFQLTIYDAAYLELAMRTGGALATRDKGLSKAASRAGVRLVD